MSVGTAASQFIEWPLHLSACQPMTRVSFLFSVGESGSRAQQVRITLGGVAARRESQQDGFFDFAAAQQLTFMPAALACARTKSGGRIPCWWAQAIRSSSEWQQQELQHWLGVRQPQLDLAHGNNSVLVFVPSGWFPAGSGMPVAVTTNAPSSTAQVPRRKNCRRAAAD